MNNFKLAFINNLGIYTDEYNYEMRLSNCIIKFKATIDIKYGTMLIDVIQTLGVAKESEKGIVYNAVYEIINHLHELYNEECLITYLNPEGDDHLFVQELNKLGMPYSNKDREKIMDDFYDLLEEMIDLNAVPEPNDSDEEIQEVLIDFDTIDDDELPF